MSRIKTPGHYIYNEYGIMKEIQEPDKSQFAEVFNYEKRKAPGSQCNPPDSRI